MIHQNDKIPLNNIDNLRRGPNINQTGRVDKHYGSRNNIDQVRQIVASVWSRSKEQQDIFQIQERDVPPPSTFITKSAIYLAPAARNL